MEPELVRMTVLGLLPEIDPRRLCPLCCNNLLVMVVGWSTSDRIIGIENGGYCDSRGCESFVLEGFEEE